MNNNLIMAGSNKVFKKWNDVRSLMPASSDGRHWLRRGQTVIGTLHTSLRHTHT